MLRYIFLIVLLIVVVDFFVSGCTTDLSWQGPPAAPNEFGYDDKGFQTDSLTGERVDTPYNRERNLMYGYGYEYFP